MNLPVIDGDGHIFEDFEGMWRYMPEVFQSHKRLDVRIFPQNDQLHTPVGDVPPAAFDYAIDADAWVRFLDALPLQGAVLYPTKGLGSGRMAAIPWARAACHAYNEWLHATYMKRDPRLHGMALIPLQDPAAAADELRYAVRELGMCGAMLPATGFRGSLGDREYWPIYRAADELRCVLAVHGGSFAGLGLDAMGIFAGAHALGHPYGVLNIFAALTFNGVFDAFPNARFGFLEAGVGWLLMALERFDGSYKAFVPFDPDNEYLKLKRGESVSERLIGHLRAGRIFCGVEGEEPLLPYAVKHIGREPWVFSSDFPHEVNPEICRHEIDELLEHAELDEADKAAILHGNAERLYGLTAATPA